MPQSTTPTVRNALLENVEHLSPLELSLLQLLAVVAEPVANNTLFDIHRKAGLTLAEETGRPPVQTLLPQLQRLKKLKLVSSDNLVHEAIAEVLVRRIFADTQTKVVPLASEPSRRTSTPKLGKSRAPQPLSLPVPVPLAVALVNAVRAALPLPSSIYSTGRQLASVCVRYMRELRLALHERNFQLLESYCKTLFSYCDARSDSIHPLIQLINTPFDPDWFGTLPPEWQTQLLSLLFTHTIRSLDADGEVLACGLNPDLRTAVSPEERISFIFDLSVRLILGGRLAEARGLVKEIFADDPESFSFGLNGWVTLLEGRLEEAIGFFDADLKELRRRLRKRTLFFSDITAPFFILALLRRGDADSLHKAGLYLEQAKRRCEHPLLMAPVLAALEAMLGSQSGLSPEAARRPIAAFRDDWNKIEGGLGPLFVGMALFSINGRLAPKEIDALNTLFIRAREADLSWLAMECAELLCRADKETSSQRDFVGTTREATGLVPLTAGIEVEEPWRKSLRALRRNRVRPRTSPCRFSQKSPVSGRPAATRD